MYSTFIFAQRKIDEQKRKTRKETYFTFSFFFFGFCLFINVTLWSAYMKKGRKMGSRAE
jgi:hypothetical protein